MKRILLLVTASSLIMLNSCKKNEYLPDTTSNSHPRPTITMNLTTDHWVPEAEGVFVSTFSNVIPPVYTNPIVKVYLVRNGSEEELSYINFNDALLWATNTRTDVLIHFRGSYRNISFLNIKIVIG